MGIGAGAAIANSSEVRVPATSAQLASLHGYGRPRDLASPLPRIATHCGGILEGGHNVGISARMAVVMIARLGIIGRCR